MYKSLTRTISQITQLIFIALIKVYQYIVSPWFVSCCRILSKLFFLCGKYNKTIWRDERRLFIGLSIIALSPFSFRGR